MNEGELLQDAVFPFLTELLFIISLYSSKTYLNQQNLLFSCFSFLFISFLFIFLRFHHSENNNSHNKPSLKLTKYIRTLATERLKHKLWISFLFLIYFLSYFKSLTLVDVEVFLILHLSFSNLDLSSLSESSTTQNSQKIQFISIFKLLFSFFLCYFIFSSHESSLTYVEFITFNFVSYLLNIFISKETKHLIKSSKLNHEISTQTLTTLHYLFYISISCVLLLPIVLFYSSSLLSFPSLSSTFLLFLSSFHLLCLLESKQKKQRVFIALNSPKSTSILSKTISNTGLVSQKSIKSLLIFGFLLLSFASSEEIYELQRFYKPLVLLIVFGVNMLPSSIADLTDSVSPLLNSSNSKKLIIFLCLNFLFMFVELIIGIASNSIGLISDAGHMFFDCIALFISLIASYLASMEQKHAFTLGYQRIEVLAGFVNAVFLIFIAFFVVTESVERLTAPPELSTKGLLLTSVGGFFINLVGVIFFHEGHSHSHAGGHSHHGHGHGGNANMRGVFLHILADLLGSAGVVISTLLIQWKGWLIADPLCSLFISVLILLSVWPLLKQTTLDLLLITSEDTNKHFQDVLDKIENLEEIETVTSSKLLQLAQGKLFVSLEVVLKSGCGSINSTDIKNRLKDMIREGMHTLNIRITIDAGYDKYDDQKEQSNEQDHNHGHKHLHKPLDTKMVDSSVAEIV